MDRRAFLSPNKLTNNNVIAQIAPPPPLSGLAIYTGTFSDEEIVHLLKRTMFGAAKADVDYFKTKTVVQAVDELINPT
ncbi:MAG: hypothetical protein H7101_13290, partial [Deinococcales bacterium]|nr:hypothetical protein [Chitinophagaceae bacterium]